MNTLAIFSLAAAFLLSPDEPSTPDTPTVVYSKKTIIEISGATIHGDVDGPGGAVVHTLRRAKPRNLIGLRAHFRDALELSAEGPSLVSR